MLAALLTNLAGGEPVWKKQQKGKRGLDPFLRRQVDEAARRNKLERERQQVLALEMAIAIDRLRNIGHDVPQLAKATEALAQRYTRTKIEPIRKELAQLRKAYVDYADMAESALARKELARLEEWADEEDALILLLSI